MRFVNLTNRRRNNGANKITGENTKDIDPIRFKKLIEADLNLNNAIDLLKIKEILNNPNFSMLIDNKLSNFKYLEDAKQIVEQDGICEQLYMVTPGDKTKIKSEILMNSDLQKKLQENRLKHTGQLDIYMATYVDMEEELNIKKYFKEREKNQYSKDFQEQGYER